MRAMNDNGGPGRYESYRQPVPLYYNPEAGSSEATLERIRDDNRIRAVAVTPEKMQLLIKEAVLQGAKRVLVSGGDGTIALVASILAGKNTEIAIIPGGTLNHFAQRIGIPIKAAEALEIALHCDAYPIDVGYVNDRLFVNTSSVGAYSVFVRSRKYLQNRMPYFPASLIAGFRRFLRFRRIRVNLAGKQLKTPLVFIGVGERELSFPTMGQTKIEGGRGLHLIAVNCKNSLEAFMLVVKSLFFGIDPLQKQRHIENQLVNAIELDFYRSKRRMRRISVALDGELVNLHTPLKYRFAPGEIMVAIPGK